MGEQGVVLPFQMPFLGGGQQTKFEATELDLPKRVSIIAIYDGSTGRLARGHPSGCIATASMRIRDIFHVTATDANHDYQGTDIKCTEVMIMGHPDNAGRVWVKNDEGATNANGWPLGASDSVVLSIETLLNLHLRIENDTEKAIIAYTD